MKYFKRFIKTLQKLNNDNNNAKDLQNLAKKQPCPACVETVLAPKSTSLPRTFPGMILKPVSVTPTPMLRLY